MKLKYVTLTGADEKTNIKDLAEISKEYPFVEWAFLLSNSTGRPRYPSLGWISAAIYQLPLSTPGTAIHLCGSLASEVFYGITKLPILSQVGRVQLNLPNYVDLNRHYFLPSVVSDDINVAPIIIQHKNTNSDVIERIVTTTNPYKINILRDCSGGRGVREEDWELPTWAVGNMKPRYGFAGGIGPSTIADDLKTLDQLLGDKETWIDMESSLRTKHNNEFDLDACRKVLEACEEYV